MKKKLISTTVTNHSRRKPDNNKSLPFVLSSVVCSMHRWVVLYSLRFKTATYASGALLIDDETACVDQSTFDKFYIPCLPAAMEVTSRGKFLVVFICYVTLKICLEKRCSISHDERALSIHDDSDSTIRGYSQIFAIFQTYDRALMILFLLSIHSMET